MINIMNKAHWTIEIDEFKFEPYKEININVGMYDAVFKRIRSNKNLRVGKINNDAYIKRHSLETGNKFNFIYDIISQHAGAAYKYVVEAFSRPVIENLPKGEAIFLNKPGPGPKGLGVNIRYFNASRIEQQGKCPVGPNDVFFSHGIGDKNYWIGPRISEFNYAFCPGPVWRDRMRDTGYQGEIFIIGYPKLDPIFNGEYEKQTYDKPCVAWLPTHGYSSRHRGRSSFPTFTRYLDQLTDEITLTKGIHPTTKMHNKEKQNPTMQELVDANVVIADAGSTVYEAWAVGKPVIFPDWICKKDVLRHFDEKNLEYQIYEKGIGYHAKDIKEMNKLIEKAIVDGMKEESKEFIEGIFPEEYRGKSGKMAADSLIKISEMVRSKSNVKKKKKRQPK